LKFQELFKRFLIIEENQWQATAEKVRNLYPDDAVVFGIAPDGDRMLQQRLLRWLADQ